MHSNYIKFNKFIAIAVIKNRILYILYDDMHTPHAGGGTFESVGE